MGTWKKNSRGQRESYFPEIGEIVSYPRSGGGVGTATRCNGVLYDLVPLSGMNSPTGVWDLQPATEADKERLRAALDLSRIPLDRTFQNTLPCGTIGHSEFLRAARARLRQTVFGRAA